MNQIQAEWWQAAITELLAGHDLVAVCAGRVFNPPEVRVKQSFKNAFTGERAGAWWVGVNDSYGVLTGAKDWTINADKRTIVAKTKNAFGDELTFMWVVVGDGDYDRWYEKMKKSWRI